MVKAWSPTRTAVLAASVMALGSVSVGLWLWRGQPGPKLDCPAEQVRLGPDGVATCGPGAELAAAAKLTVGAKLELNRATAEDLAAIDGVGPALARAIVEARTARGSFKVWEDLDTVPGVGPARLEALKAVATLETR